MLITVPTSTNGIKNKASFLFILFIKIATFANITKDMDAINMIMQIFIIPYTLPIDKRTSKSPIPINALAIRQNTYTTTGKLIPITMYNKLFFMKVMPNIRLNASNITTEIVGIFLYFMSYTLITEIITRTRML